MKFRIVAVVFMLAGLLVRTSPGRAASLELNFNDYSFQTTWNRTDKAVEEIFNPGRGYTWGPPVSVTESILTTTPPLSIMLPMFL